MGRSGNTRRQMKRGHISGHISSSKRYGGSAKKKRQQRAGGSDERTGGIVSWGRDGGNS